MTLMQVLTDSIGPRLTGTQKLAVGTGLDQKDGGSSYIDLLSPRVRTLEEGGKAWRR